MQQDRNKSRRPSSSIQQNSARRKEKPRKAYDWTQDVYKRQAYGNAIADANATTYAAKDGSNLVLSLDVNIQEVVERYLNEAVAANTVAVSYTHLDVYKRQTKSCVLTIIWRYENTKQLLAGQGARAAGEGGRYMRVRCV